MVSLYRFFLSLILLLFLTLFLFVLLSARPQTELGLPDGEWPEGTIPDREVLLIIEDDLAMCGGAFFDVPCRTINGRVSSDLPNGYEHGPEGDLVKVLAVESDLGANIQDVGRFQYMTVREVDRISEESDSSADRLCGFFEGNWNGRGRECVAPVSVESYCRRVGGEVRKCAGCSKGESSCVVPEI